MAETPKEGEGKEGNGDKGGPTPEEKERMKKKIEDELYGEEGS